MTTAKRAERASMYLTAASVLDHLAVEVKEEREKRKLSLRKAAEQIGMSWTTLHHVEQRLHNPRVDVAQKLLRWLATT